MIDIGTAYLKSLPTFLSLVLQDMSKTTRENILNQASFSLNTWVLATEVMTSFEEGQLKRQGKNLGNKSSAVSIKQHHFQPLHHLPEEFQVRQNQHSTHH